MSAAVVAKVFVAKPLFEFLRGPCQLTVLGCRRFFSVVGFVGSAASMALVVFGGTYTVDTTSTAVTTTGAAISTLGFTLAMGFIGLHPSGFKANYMDLSLHSSGLLSGMGNTMASLAAFVAPLVVGHVLKEYVRCPAPRAPPSMPFCPVFVC